MFLWTQTKLNIIEMLGSRSFAHCNFNIIRRTRCFSSTPVLSSSKFYNLEVKLGEISKKDFDQHKLNYYLRQLKQITLETQQPFEIPASLITKFIRKSSLNKIPVTDKPKDFARFLVNCSDLNTVTTEDILYLIKTIAETQAKVSSNLLVQIILNEVKTRSLSLNQRIQICENLYLLLDHNEDPLKYQELNDALGDFTRSILSPENIGNELHSLSEKDLSSLSNLFLRLPTIDKSLQDMLLTEINKRNILTSLNETWFDLTNLLVLIEDHEEMLSTFESQLRRNYNLNYNPINPAKILFSWLPIISKYDDLVKKITPPRNYVLESGNILSRELEKILKKYSLASLGPFIQKFSEIAQFDLQIFESIVKKAKLEGESPNIVTAIDKYLAEKTITVFGSQRFFNFLRILVLFDYPISKDLRYTILQEMKLREFEKMDSQHHLAIIKILFKDQEDKLIQEVFNEKDRKGFVNMLLDSKATLSEDVLLELAKSKIVQSDKSLNSKLSKLINHRLSTMESFLSSRSSSYFEELTTFSFRESFPRLQDIVPKSLMGNLNPISYQGFNRLLKTVSRGTYDFRILHNFGAQFEMEKSATTQDLLDQLLGFVPLEEGDKHLSDNIENETDEES